MKTHPGARCTVLICLLLAGAARGGAPASEPASGAASAPVETYVVHATRLDRPASQVPAAVTVLDRTDIEHSSAVTADDLLRQVPGFNTFRRSSSMVTAPAEDPEAQGVTLRGIGPGGASRALVLVDGIPANDAFGGWLYWGEIPLENIESVEIVKGGGSSLWGDFAEGGVIDFVSRRLEDHSVRLKLAAGTLGTTDDALSVNESVGAVKLGLTGHFFHTDGYDIVTPAQRGPIDQPAGSENHLIAGRAEWAAANDLTLYVRGSTFDQTLAGGTALRTAATARDFVAAGGTLGTRESGRFDLNLYARRTRVDQTFTLASADRTAEAVAQVQSVPSNDSGGSFTWARALSSRSRVTLGTDYRSVRGQSLDDFLDPTGLFVTEHRVSRGKQDFLGAFAQGDLDLTSRLNLVLEARVDHFRSFEGAVFSDVPGAGATAFADQTHTSVDPRLSLRYRVRDGLALRGAVYRAFRAPTLAELFRRSSVEGLVLHENPDLQPEFLEGGEIGVDLSEHPRWRAGATLYTNRLLRPIGNVVTATDPVTGADSERSRVNFGLARIRGGELDFDYDLSPRWNTRFAYLHTQAKLEENPADPTLEGKRITQVPEDSGTLTLRYHDPARVDARVAGRFVGLQFEDADNHDALHGYFVMDLSVTAPLHRRAGGDDELFVAVQNLFDRSYDVDRGGGILKLGTPFVAQLGTRLFF